MNRTTIAALLGVILLVATASASSARPTATVKPVSAPFMPMTAHKTIPWPTEAPEPSYEATPLITLPPPLPEPTPTPTVVTLRATWYCGHGSRCTVGYPTGLYAAISPDMRWLGKHLLVRYGSRSVAVTVIDCDCSTTRGIDLYSSAFALLAPLSTGVIMVAAQGLP